VHKISTGKYRKPDKVGKQKNPLIMAKRELLTIKNGQISKEQHDAADQKAKN
jgi:hypothetical protein